jgi:hypothetical protein
MVAITNYARIAGEHIANTLQGFFSVAFLI